MLFMPLRVLVYLLFMVLFWPLQVLLSAFYACYVRVVKGGPEAGLGKQVRSNRTHPRRSHKAALTPARRPAVAGLLRRPPRLPVPTGLHQVLRPGQADQTLLRDGPPARSTCGGAQRRSGRGCSTARGSSPLSQGEAAPALGAPRTALTATLRRRRRRRRAEPHQCGSAARGRRGIGRWAWRRGEPATPGCDPRVELRCSPHRSPRPLHRSPLPILTGRPGRDPPARRRRRWRVRRRSGRRGSSVSAARLASAIAAATLARTAHAMPSRVSSRSSVAV